MKKFQSTAKTDADRFSASLSGMLEIWSHSHLSSQEELQHNRFFRFIDKADRSKGSEIYETYEHKDLWEYVDFADPRYVIDAFIVLMDSVANGQLEEIITLSRGMLELLNGMDSDQAEVYTALVSTMEEFHSLVKEGSYASWLPQQDVEIELAKKGIVRKKRKYNNGN